MTEQAIALAVSVLVAVLGSVAGFAALLKVNADNSETISDSASTLVSTMAARMKAAEYRLDELEDYAVRFDDWGDRVVALLDRAVREMPAAHRAAFLAEAQVIKSTRPPRPRHHPKDPP